MLQIYLLDLIIISLKIYETFVVYDGCKTKNNDVISLFRYYGQCGTIEDINF